MPYIPKQKTVDIELISWAHHFTWITHQKILEYIRTIPRGSILIMEITPEQQSRFEQFLEDPENYNVGHLQDDNFERNQKLMKLSGYELYLECLKRDIKVVRIEDSVLRRKITQINDNAKSWEDNEETMKYVYERDEIMARRIAETIKLFKNNKFYVLAGGKHIPGILSSLEQQQIPNTKINITENEELKRVYLKEREIVINQGRLTGFRNDAQAKLKQAYANYKATKENRLRRRLTKRQRLA